MSIAGKLYALMSKLQQGLRPLLPIVILVIYTVVGAQIFLWCEKSNELEQLQQLKVDRDELTKKFSFDVYKSGCLLKDAKKAKRQITHQLLKYSEQLGVDAVDFTQTKWTFVGSIFYTLTVYTTIGYGNIYPVTRAGQMLTIVYAFFGIPLALITLIGLGGLFAKGCKILWKILVHSIAKSTSIVSKDIEKQVQKLKISEDSAKKSEDNEDLLSFPVSFLIGITLVWVFLCAAIFMQIESEWNYGTSLYFTLISFTTIGFGDVLPSKKDYMIFVGLCVLIGLSLVSTVLTIIQQQIEALASRVDSDIDKNYRDALESAYGQEDEDAEEKRPEDEDNRKSPKAQRSSFDKANLHVDSIVSKMSLKDRILFSAMSKGHKEKIKEKANKRMNARVGGTQTDRFDVQTPTQTEEIYMEPLEVAARRLSR